MIKHRIGYKSMSASLDDISNFLKATMMPFWDDLGLELTKFYITSIDIDSSTPEGKRVLEAIAQQSSMSITGHTWQQEQMFGVANNAIGGLSSGSGGLIGGLIAMNMLGGMGGSAATGMTAPQYNQPTFAGNNNPDGLEQQSGQPQQVREIYCSNCAKKFPSTYRFCPHCGDLYNACPKCGTDNDASAKRCISCGTPLQAEAATCPNCNTPLIPGSAFCGNCGKQLQTGDSNCNRCGTPLAPNMKFCPRCGNKRNS
jgi:membrane protease subunit (stomatin/prohibitin family)